VAGSSPRAIPVDYAGSRIPAALSRFRERWPDVSYNVCSAPVEEIIHDLKHGVLDIVLELFSERPTVEARHIWTQELVWVHSDAVKFDPGGPMLLVFPMGWTVPVSAPQSPLRAHGPRWGDRTAIEELADYLKIQIQAEPNSLGFVDSTRRG
jgi:DNA-binding transcriptional LysR family regulator